MAAQDGEARARDSSSSVPVPAASGPYLGRVSAVYGCISAVSRLYLGRISAVSRLYLGCRYVLAIPCGKSQGILIDGAAENSPVPITACNGYLTACNDHVTACND